jgi:hypothetical protein
MCIKNSNQPKKAIKSSASKKPAAVSASAAVSAAFMTITSTDGTEFQLTRQAVQHSPLLQECDHDHALPLLNVATEYTRCIADILNFIGAKGMPTLQRPTLPLYDMLPHTNSGLVQLYRAARYILCDDIIKLVCLKIAHNTNHLSPPNIRVQVQDIEESDLLPFIPELATVEPTRLINSLERFAWLVQTGHASDITCIDIIQHCQHADTIEALKLARQHGCPCDDGTCAYAAREGRLDVLQWLRENGCDWDVMTCRKAAERGHLHVLKWARENGCEWDSWTCAAAASRGHLDVLKWLRENGCPWSAWTCDFAAAQGHLDVWKWARENGCPYD